MKFRLNTTVLAVAVLALLVLTGCSAGDEVTIKHMHGLGFSADGKQLYVPAHDGFVIYSEGKWQTPAVPKHDYMGYSATDGGFYSSGHPAPGSGLQNPLGLVKSSDGGKTLTSLGFQGEIDFHSMGVGYKNHAVYVFYPGKNPKLQPGLNYTLDDGKSWKPSGMQGITSAPIQVAVHPNEANLVALAAEDGLYLSTDHGTRFERIGEQAPITTAAFTPNGDQLIFGFQKLYAYNLANKQVQTLQTPFVAEKDAIGYVAVNPTQPKEIVFGTFGREIHRSVDGGQTWEQIASQGKGRASK
jgi:hypothetical protein